MLEIGSVIDGKYKILNVIGKGGMSIVYLAINERANKPWAVKEIRRNDLMGFELDKKEINMMKKLKHPNLPSVIDVIEKDETLLIVMDYIEGRSLEDILKEQGAQPEDEVLCWAKQLCDVLIYLHSRSPAIIYRDMKPANVMLKPDGNVCLIDFGAAREFKTWNVKDTISLGTQGYAAPEQYEDNGQSDARTDIYGLGVMLFQLLTGASPHQLCPIREMAPGLSAGLEAVLVKCTQVRKEDRFSSCEELLYALEHYWELDSSYRCVQKKKLAGFLVPVFLSFALGCGAALCAGMEFHLRKNNYESYLLSARNSVSKEDEIANYKKAINLYPFREEAYRELLKNALLDDGLLTVDESGLLRSVLIEYGDGKKTNESVFRMNEEGYEQFAYEAGIAYFYKFEEKSNKKYARSYLETASKSEHLEPEKQNRAKRLYTISDYYSRIGIMDEAGDELVTYRDYWDDLTDLSDGNLVEEDNARTALVMYKELVSQMVSHTLEFQKSGVTKGEMLSQLVQMDEHLRKDFIGSEGSTQKLFIEEIQELKRCMEQAERLILSAYGRREQEER